MQEVGGQSSFWRLLGVFRPADVSRIYNKIEMRGISDHGLVLRRAAVPQLHPGSAAAAGRTPAAVRPACKSAANMHKSPIWALLLLLFFQETLIFFVPLLHSLR